MPSDFDRLERNRSLWRYTGVKRPPFAMPAGPGQESVWDYPRPPRIAPDAREVVVSLGGVEVARTRRALRILETASPPTFYLPLADVRGDCLTPIDGSSFCEWKGEARYFSIVLPHERVEGAAWFYPEPLHGYEALHDHVAFYPHRLECLVGGVRAQPQPGRFYAGWVTPEVVGPFKGEPGSGDW